MEFSFLKVLVLIRQVHQKNVLFSTIGIKGFKFQLDIHNECHDALIMSMNLSGIAILNIQGVDYHCIINRISKGEDINLLQNADLNEKSGK